LRLQHAFYKFPFRFDVERLKAEVTAIPEDRWCRHPGNYKGNSHLPLISTDGAVNDRFDPPMRPTQTFATLPYVQQVLARFKTLHGRARLMRLEPGDGVPAHVDAEYYWRTHTRVHIPIVTHPGVRFHCGQESVHMAEGEAWTFDNWRTHRVVNDTPTRRIHLTFDTYGSNAFWAAARPHPSPEPEELVAFDPAAHPTLAYETYVGDPVMSPAEMDIEMMRLAADIAAAPQNDPAAVRFIQNLTLAFRRDWRELWYEQGPGPHSVAAFGALRARMAQECRRSVPETVVVASNGITALRVLHSIFGSATREGSDATRARPRTEPRFDRPVFIVCAPRSGSTLLFETFSRNGTLWTLGGEGHGHVESIPGLTPQHRGFDSNRLTAQDLTPEIAAKLRGNYAANLRDAAGTSYAEAADAPASVRFLEKTPKNALRIPFFKAMFPDAKFVFLQREPRANISAIMEAWRSGGFVTYRNLPSWSGLPWSLLLIPGWQALVGRDLAEIAARQWRVTTETILDDLEAMQAADWCSVRYEDLLAAPATFLERLCAFADLPFDAGMEAVAAAPLKPSRYTISAPNAEKWRKNEAAIAPHLGALRATADRLARLADRDRVVAAAQ
jgi:sulfotransferase family protein/aspartyl/asparaginyl beta-hydroxylase